MAKANPSETETQPRANASGNRSSADAIAWLRGVGGELFRTANVAGRGPAWVAVVRTPRVTRARGKMIIALGETPKEAIATAIEQWDQTFDGNQAAH